MAIGYGDSAIDRARASLLAESQRREWRWWRRRQGADDRVSDVERQALPDERPSNAQWDEAAGRWEVWSEEQQGWVSLDDGTIQAPGTPSVAPTEEAIERPPAIDQG